MSSKVRMDLSVPVSAATFQAKTRLINTDGRSSFNRFGDYLHAIAGGPYAGSAVVTEGAVNAYGLITSTGSATNGQQMTVANTTLTAKTSGANPAAGEFNISGTVATQAANIAAAINAVSALSGVVTATSALGVVTVTAVAPGSIGNGLELSAGNLSNVTVTAFANGANGTVYTFSNGY